MTNELPTFDVVAGLGVLILFLRSLSLYRAARAIPEVTRLLLEWIREGHFSSALRFAERAESSELPQVATEILRAVREPSPASERRPGQTPSEPLSRLLERRAERALSMLQRRVQSGRARDLIVLAVLSGAVLYASRTNLGVSALFYALSALGALLLVVTFFLRGRVLDITRRSARDLVAAASTTRPRAESLSPRPCPRCGETALVTPSGPMNLQTLDAALRLADVSFCTQCGHVEGTAEDPQALGKQAGSSSVSKASDLEEPLRDALEHEG